MIAPRGASSHRLTAAQFAAAEKVMRMEKDRLTAARAVVVDGVSIQDVADANGWSRQSVYAAVRAVMAAWERCAEVIALADSAGARTKKRSSP